MVYNKFMEVKVDPWYGKWLTCVRCRGPWGQNCIDGKRRCHRVNIFWDNSYPCAACGAIVHTAGPMPEKWDDSAWAKIQAEHSQTCPWASTLGYLIDQASPLQVG